MTEPWTSKPSILFSQKNLRYFVPTEDMTYVEKINAIYCSIIVFIIRGDYAVFLFPIIGMLVLYFLITWGKNLDELKESFDDEKAPIQCRVPSLNNPFMNILPLDNRNIQPACPYTKDTKSQIESSFNSNLYQDIDDIYGTNNSQRQFYTMPSSTIPNNQDSFAKWLYKTGPTCKENAC